MHQGEEWRKRSWTLRYMLSDLCVGTAHFEGMGTRLELDPEREPVSDHILAERSFEGGVEFYCVSGVPIQAAVPRMTDPGWAVRYAVNQDFQYYASLQGGFEGYLQSFSSKTRSTVQRKVRKAVGEGFSIEGFSKAEEMRHYHARAREVARLTYQERLFDGAIPEGEEYVRELEQSAAKGEVRGYLLMKEGRAAAYLHLPVSGGVVDYEYLGYDPAAAAWSPGTVLLYLALEKLFEEGKHEYMDFSYGLNQTKETFSTGKYLRADFYYFEPSAKNKALLKGHWWMDRFSGWSGRAMERLGLKQRVKRLLRRG